MRVVGFFVAHILAAVNCQAAEPSPWDSDVQGCTSATPGSAEIYDVSQSDASSVTVKFRGYASYPTALWLTSEEGTVIAYTDTGLSTTGDVTLAFTGPKPLSVGVHSCPPSYNTTTLRTWRGVYEDATEECCSDLGVTDAERTAYEPSFTLTAANWQSQEFSVTASNKGVINFAKDASGEIIHLNQGGSGFYSSPAVAIPPLTTRLFACATLPESINGDTGNTVLKNPLCVEENLVTRIVDNLEQRSDNPAAQPDNDALNITYKGSVEAITATFTKACATDDGIIYARADTMSGTILGFAQGDALSLEISSMADASTMYVYQCCGFTVAARATPVDCPSGALLAYTIDVDATKAAGRTQIATAFSTSGVGTMSATGDRCDDGLYGPGDYVLNTTDGSNCTCVAPDESLGQFAPSWQCVSRWGEKSSWFTPGQQAAIYLVIIICVAILIFAGCFLYFKRTATPIYKGSTTSASYPQASGAETYT